MTLKRDLKEKLTYLNTWSFDPDPENWVDHEKFHEKFSPKNKNMNVHKYSRSTRTLSGSNTDQE